MKQDWRERYAAKKRESREAVRLIGRGKHIFVGSGAAEPVGLVEALVAEADHFADNPVVHLLTLGPAPYVEPRYESNFRHNAYFIGPNVRAAVRAGRADYTPVFLSQVPDLIRSRRTPVDVALILTSPPDDYGFVNLGVAVDVVLAAVEAADMVIAEINPNMPVVFGGGFLPMDIVDYWTWNDRPLLTVEREELDDVALEIGRNVAGLVEDGATLQAGIGQVPDAALRALTGKKDLGVWTEMFSDGIIDLIENGNITGKYKAIHPRKVTSSFTFGTKRVYDFIDRNPVFTFHPSDYVNDPIKIARQHRMVSINSALQIDLTGQVCADSIGAKFYSGIGGQVDFIRGASMCPGGVPIIAIRSTARDGTISRIATTLEPGAGVVTSRGDVWFVVTEYGVADLQGKSVRERALSLIAIAHPDFRAELLAAAKERHYVFQDQVSPHPGYPWQYESDVEANDGTRLRLRPLRVTDEQKLTDLFYSLSNDTIYRRWMTAKKRLPHRDALYYLDIDYQNAMAIVLETCEERREPEMIGVGRYHLDRATNYAEVAFLIRDAWQGKGLGTLLLQQLIRIARDKGIAGFTASVLATNRGMLHVFHRAGLEMTTRLEDGVYELTMGFGGSEPKSGIVRSVAQKFVGEDVEDVEEDNG